MSRRKQPNVGVSPVQAEYLTTEGASEFTGIAIKTLTTWRSRDREQGPPYRKVGRMVRYSVSDLRSWMDQRQRNKPAGGEGEE